MAEAANKIAVVTGAGTGVGRAASLALMNAGFTVVLAGRRMEMLEETKKLGDNVGKSMCVSADMTNPGSIAALFGTVPAAVLGGAGTIAIALLWMKLFPSLRKVERLE